MNRRDHDRLMKPLCKQLNALIPINGTEDKDKINALIYEVSQKVPDFNLYWNLEMYINCGCDDKKVRHYTLHSGKVHFEPSDDPDEHPGITIRYVCQSLRIDKFLLKETPLVANTEEKRKHIKEILYDVNYVDMSEHGEVEVFIDGSISYDKMAEIVDYLRNK